MKEGLVYEKTFEFALKIIELYKKLVNENEYIMSKQLLRSSTSIGANIKEALNSQSKKDFLSKMNIALKKSSETEYWLELLLATKYLDVENGENLLIKCKEINKLLSSIVKTTKKTIEKGVQNENTK
ncbi:four helix bundle protein [bacterium]|nr:four helix bundle protein [bacterium]